MSTLSAYPTALVFNAIFLAAMAFDCPDLMATPKGNSGFVPKQLEERTAVVIEYEGSYWRIGGLIDKVALFKEQHQISEPVFVRYAQVPGVAASSLLCWIGCSMDPSFSPEIPFRKLTLPAELVVTLPIDRSELTPAEYGAWIGSKLADSGHKPAGPVIELYRERSSQKGAPSGLEIYALEIVVLPIEAKPDPVVATKTVESVSPGEVVTIVLESSKGNDVPKEEPTKVKETAATEAPSASKALEPPAVPLIAELARSGNFEAIALLMIPDHIHRDAFTCAWLGVVVSRVSAASRGVEKLFPSHENSIAPLSETLERRAHTVLGKIAPMSQTALVQELAKPGHERQRLVVRDLDRTLGRLAVRGLDPKSCQEEIVSILQQVLFVLGPPNPSNIEVPPQEKTRP